MTRRLGLAFGLVIGQLLLGAWTGLIAVKSADTAQRPMIGVIALLAATSIASGTWVAVRTTRIVRSERLTRVAADGHQLQQVSRDIGRRIREHLDANSLMTEAVSGLGVALDVDRVYIRLMEGDRIGPVVREWTAPGVRPVAGDPRLPPASVDVIRRLHDTDSAIIVTDSAAAERVDHPAWPEFVAATGAKALVVVPLATGPDLIGLVLLMTVRRPREWTPAELQLIENVAADATRGFRQAQLYEAQAQVVMQLREVDRVKDEFVSMVSHELRTPLTSILGYVELLSDGDAGPLTGGQQHMLGVVARNTAQLRSLIEDLLTLSRIESGRHGRQQSAIELGPIVAKVCAAVPPEREGELDFDCHVSPEPLLVMGDADQLDRMLRNLVSNAMKFTPGDGRVAVSATHSGDAAVLTVADSGMGVPADEVGSVFVRFFRASNATRQAVQGTGLGLAIVRMIVELHGGQVSIDSVLGEGTTVTVRIPLAPAAALATAAAGNTRRGDGVQVTVPASGTIMSGSGSRGAESFDSPPRPGGPSI